MKTLCAIFAILFCTLLLQPDLFSQSAMGERPVEGLLASKLYKLEKASAVKLAPILEAALRNANPEASAECIALEPRNSLLLTLPRASLPTADALVKALDVPSDGASASPFVVTPDFKSYKPRYIPAKSAAKMIASLQSDDFSGQIVLLDSASGTVYWKGPALFCEAVDSMLAAGDTPQTQTRLIIKVYRFDVKGVRALGKALLAKNRNPQTSAEDLIYAAIRSHRNVDMVANAECSIAQGIKTSSVVIDLGEANKFKLTSVYPMVDLKGDGSLSVYTDFVLAFAADTRSSRWTLNSNRERPLAAFVLKDGPNEAPSYVDMAELSSPLKDQDSFAVTGEMLIITGLVLPARD